MKSKHLIPLLALPILALPVQAAFVITGGHVDVIAFEYVSGTGFAAEIHNEGGADGAIVNGVRISDPSHYEPDETTIVIANSSTTSFDGKTYFWLPSDETDAANNGVPFAGIGLEELMVADWTGDFTITLSSVSFTGTGTGQFLLWTDSPAEILHFDSEDLANFDSIDLAPDTHSHFNWGFSDVGTYEIIIGISGDHVADSLQSGSATYTFQVVPEPSSALLGTFGALALLRRKRN